MSLVSIFLRRHFFKINLDFFLSIFFLLIFRNNRKLEKTDIRNISTPVVIFCQYFFRWDPLTFTTLVFLRVQNPKSLKWLCNSPPGRVLILELLFLTNYFISLRYSIIVSKESKVSMRQVTDTALKQNYKSEQNQHLPQTTRLRFSSSSLFFEQFAKKTARTGFDCLIAHSRLKDFYIAAQNFM